MNKKIHEAQLKLRELHKKYQNEFFVIAKKIDDFLEELQQKEETE